MQYEKLLDIARSEVFTAVTLKNSVFWVVAPCGLCKDRRFGETYGLHVHGEKNNISSERTSVPSYC
jgi:hypothetical protein